MRQAIANAAVGDEQKREDPTVNELERQGAEFLGHEEAVFLPTATMANQIALNILGRPGDALLVERQAHIMLSELGGPAAHSGLLTIGLVGDEGPVLAGASRRGDSRPHKRARRADTRGHDREHAQQLGGPRVAARRGRCHRRNLP